MSLPFTPLIIIGAPRSGTNALRDALTSLPDLATWPCDEINPIWRHGNLNSPHDALTPAQATPQVRRFIRRAFERLWQDQGKPAVVVEKTCANCLRVPFIDAILPEARFIHITRNGLDVAASAAKRWQGQLEVPGLPYYRAKIRYAPKLDLPAYGARAGREWKTTRMPPLKSFAHANGPPASQRPHQPLRRLRQPVSIPSLMRIS